MPASTSKDLDALKSKRIDVKATKNAITNGNGLASLLGKRESLKSTEKLEKETKSAVRNDPEGTFAHKRVDQDEARESKSK